MYIKVNQSIVSFQNQLNKQPNILDCGIYKLFYFSDGKPKTIPRLYSEDITGTLYIRMTNGPLKIRVSNLQKALLLNSNAEKLKPVNSGHSQMGRKYFRIRKR